MQAAFDVRYFRMLGIQIQNDMFQELRLTQQSNPVKVWAGIWEVSDSWSGTTQDVQEAASSVSCWPQLNWKKCHPGGTAD